jgi:hypothetical protein
MRTNEHLNSGLGLDEAAAYAQRQFGDPDMAVSGMRQARISSLVTLFAMTAVLMTMVMFWVMQQRTRSMTTDLQLPAAPVAPRMKNPDQLSTLRRPPPRPAPPPTWEQYMKQTKAFEALQKGPGTYSPGKPLHETPSGR